MTTEQRINGDLKGCIYTLIEEHFNTKIWERKCIHDHIDYVVGIKWVKKDTPIAEDFDIKPKNAAFRFLDKENALNYYNKKK